MLPEFKNFAYSFDELGITVGLVEQAMGYKAGQSPEPIPDMISNALVQCDSLCDIQGSLLVYNNFSKAQKGSIAVGGVMFNIGKKLSRQLRDAEGIALFIVTAGAGIGEKSRELMAAGDLLEGYILDVIGSETVEAAIDKIQDTFETDLKKNGMNIANRYSPGYCGWALSEQKQFFGLFPDNHCGIKLSDSCLMNPIKSVSGIIGFGTKLRKVAYQCQICELENCVYRKLRLARVS